MICVYKIINPKDRIYVGSTIDYKERLASYKRLDCEQQPRLYFSFKKYGIDAHAFEVIEICTMVNVREREAYHGHLLNVLSRQGLNCMLPKAGEKVACVSEQWRINMGKLKKGNKNTFGRKATMEQKAYLSLIRKGQSKKPHAQKTKDKISSSAMGGKNHKAVILLNIETGIYYECFKDASFSVDMNYNTFRSNLYHGKEMPFIRV